MSSIGGTEFSEATIDGSDVQEITVDGDVVWQRISVVAASNLVAWYPFSNLTSDRTAGNSEYGDSTDYSLTNDGATHLSAGGVVDIQDGSNSGAYAVDTSADRLYTSNISSEYTEMSVSVWVYPTSFPEYSQVIGENDSRPYDSWQLRKDNSDIYEFNINGSYGNGGTSVNLSEWTHLVGTYDGSTVRLYKNGSEVNSHSSSGSVNIGGISVGEYGGSNVGSYPFDGTIDDVRIYNTSLSDTEISNIYQNTTV